MLQRAVPEIPVTAKGQNPCLGPRGCTESQGPEPLSGSKGLHWQSRTRTPVWVQGAALTVKDQNPCLGPGGCTDSQRPEPLSGSRGLHWQRPEPLSGSRGLHWQSKTRTPVWVQGVALTKTRTTVWVQGVALTVKDQNPCLGPGGCTDSQWPEPLSGSRGLHWQRPEPLSGSRGLHWQSKTRTPVWVQEVALTVKDHNSCLGPGGCTDSQGPQLLSGSRGLHWQSRTTTPVWVQGATLTAKDQNPCLGPGGFPTAVHTVAHTSAVVPTTTTLGISILELCHVTNSP